MWEFNCAQARSALDEKGFWLCDAAVSKESASNIRTELLQAHTSELLSLSGNVLAVRAPDGTRQGVTLKKTSIFEADVIADGVVQRQDVLDSCPTLAKLLQNEGALRSRLNVAMPELGLDRLEQAKVQVNDGSGGAFPYHFDVPAAKDARRHLTAILYLNPEWQEGDGGELEVLPFPFPDLSIPPLDQRFVAFASNTTLHRVSPYSGAAGRVCVNLWFDGDISIAFPPPLPLPEDDGCLEEDSPEIVEALKIVRILRRQPLEHRAMCKVWYKETMAASICDAFQPGSTRDAAVALHMEESAQVESRISANTLATLRAALPLRPQAPAKPGPPPVVEEEAEPDDCELADLFAGI